MQEDGKARENGEAYAIRTALAAAFGRPLLIMNPAPRPTRWC